MVNEQTAWCSRTQMNHESVLRIAMSPLTFRERGKEQLAE